MFISQTLFRLYIMVSTWEKCSELCKFSHEVTGNRNKEESKSYVENNDLPQVRQYNETSDEDDNPQHWARCQHKCLLQSHQPTSQVCSDSHCSETGTGEGMRRKGGKSSKTKSIISYEAFSCIECCSEITMVTLVSGNFAHWKTLLEMK